MSSFEMVCSSSVESSISLHITSLPVSPIFSQPTWPVPLSSHRPSLAKWYSFTLLSVVRSRFMKNLNMVANQRDQNLLLANSDINVDVGLNCDGGDVLHVFGRGLKVN